MMNSENKREVAPKLPVLDLTNFPNAIRSASEKLPTEFDLSFKSDHFIQVDPRWESVLSEVVQFKVAVDHIVEGSEEDIAANDHTAILYRYGVDSSRLTRRAGKRHDDSGLSNTWPEHFLPNFIFGYFHHVDDIRIKAIGWVPPWVRVGRLYKPDVIRRACKLLSAADVERTVAAMESENARYSSTSNGWLFGGIPLVQAGENKNRYQFYWKYGLDQFVRLHVYSYPEPAALRLQRVPFEHRMVALHLLDACGRTRKTSLLPLSDLASPVLESYGVTWLPSVWHGYFSPFSIVVAEGGAISWFQRLRPRRLWRKLVYGHSG